MSLEIEEIRVVCFRLGEDLYAADIMRVKEITKPLKPAGLPDAPDYIDGMINLRGTVIPILNLRKRFRLTSPPDEVNARLLIVVLRGQHFALLVDEVTEVITVPVKDLRPPPQFSGGIASEYLIAVCLVEESLVMLVNLDSILHAQEVDAVRRINMDGDSNGAEEENG